MTTDVILEETVQVDASSLPLDAYAANFLRVIQERAKIDWRDWELKDDRYLPDFKVLNSIPKQASRVKDANQT